MNKREISEIKKTFTITNCCIREICTCYVNAEKEKQMQGTRLFLNIDEEEQFKFLDIFKKSLSGKIKKSLFHVDFPIDSLAVSNFNNLRKSGLSVPVTEQLFDLIIKNYDFVGPYAIIAAHGIYDVPNKSSDRTVLEYGDDVYDFLIVSICPVALDKPGLEYKSESNEMKNRERNLIVGIPKDAILWPAFDDRTENVNALYYYNKKDQQSDLISVLTDGGVIPSDIQAESNWFHELLQSSDITFEKWKSLKDSIDEKKAAGIDSIDKLELKKMLEEAEINQKDFDINSFDQIIGKGQNISLQSLSESKTLDITSANYSIKSEYTEDLSITEVNGKKCIVIPITDSAATVNNVLLNLLK